MPPPRAGRLVVVMVAAAIVCLAGIGWTATTYVGRSSSPSIGAYSVEAQQSSEDVGGVVTLAAPEPAAAPVAQPSPVYAYSAPPQGYRRGTFIPPVGGWVAQVFGPTDFTLEPPRTYNGVAYPHFHTGIDIDTAQDTPIAASAAGVVTKVAAETDGQGHLIGYGNYVVIQHRLGFETLYAHLDRPLVIVGQQVAQLQVIGLVGSTGLSTGPHLHFEIHRYGGLLDPLPYLLGRIKPW